jgi:hypothetical protein
MLDLRDGAFRSSVAAKSVLPSPRGHRRIPASQPAPGSEKRRALSEVRKCANNLSKGGTMLKKAVVCILLAAAAAMAWERLTDVPNHVDVYYGTHLIWGDTLLWGVFPSTGSPDATYLASFNPSADEDSAWDTLRISGVPLGRTGIAFQWVERPVVWAMGKDANEISRLYRYDVRTGVTTQETLSFTLDLGACIAYAPNEGYNPYSYPIPGWLFFLPGGGTTFWRHWIPAESMPDPGEYGYLYPDSGVTIADPTPPFRWSPAASAQYRIQVSTDPNFGSNAIDEVVATNQCQSTTQLSDTIYYWRVATWTLGDWSWPIGRYCFRLHPGWDSLPDLDVNARSGAKIAFCDADAFGHEAIVAMYGGTDKCFAEYCIGGGYWTNLPDVPEEVNNDGASLTTNAAVGGGYRIYAAFDADAEYECPHYYDKYNNRWDFLDDDDTSDFYNTHFRDDIDAGSSMAIGADDMMYLTTGTGRRFYGVSISRFPGGQQARVVPSGRPKAQAVTVRDGVEVEYQLPAAAHVRASLHDALGRRVGTLDAGKQNPGMHRLGWNSSPEGRKLSAGAYFVLLDMGKEQARLKAVVE